MCYSIFDNTIEGIWNISMWYNTVARVWYIFLILCDNIEPHIIEKVTNKSLVFLMYCENTPFTYFHK